MKRSSEKDICSSVNIIASGTGMNADEWHQSREKLLNQIRQDFEFIKLSEAKLQHSQDIINRIIDEAEKEFGPEANASANDLAVNE